MSENELIINLSINGYTGRLLIKRSRHPLLFLSLWKKPTLTGFTFLRNDIMYIKMNLEVGGKGNVEEAEEGVVIFDVAESSLGILLKKTKLTPSQIVIGKFDGNLKELRKYVGRIAVLKH